MIVSERISKKIDLSGRDVNSANSLSEISCTTDAQQQGVSIVINESSGREVRL